MRALPTFAAMIAFVAGVAVTLPASADDAAPAAKQNAAPLSKQDATASSTNENEKGNQALRDTPSTGRTEQSATEAAGAHLAGDGATQQPEGPALVNGRLNVKGAPQDSQTVPAKVSARNDALDHVPIMAQPLRLTDEQKRKIADAVLAAHAPVADIGARPADALPYQVSMQDLPGGISDPAVGGLKFVETVDSILLVRPSTRIVVGEITK